MILLLSVISTLSNAEIKLHFGHYTSDLPSDLIKKFTPIINFLEKRLTSELAQKVSIKFTITPSYSAGINQLVTGHIDLMRMGPASYILAHKQNPNIEIIAAESNKGEKKFKGIICAKDNNSIKTIQDLKGHSFAFGNENSTIGRYLSQRFLSKNNIHARDLSKFKYFKSHDKVGAMVALGIFDAGALKNSTYKKILKKGAKLRKLAEFDNVTKPWVARAGLDKSIIRALRKTLLSMKNHKALKKLKKDGFLPATIDDYKVIQTAIEHNSDFFNN